MNASFRFWPAAAILAVLLFGCGVKAPPLSPKAFLPARVQGLEYHFDEQGLLVLNFRSPHESRLQKPLKEIGGFYVDWSGNKIGPDFCPGCPVEYKNRVKIEAREPGLEETVWPGVYQYKSRLIPGHVYHFRIFSLDLNGRYDPLQVRKMVIFYDHPSNPPPAVTVKASDRLVSLIWTPPERMVNGEPLDDLAGFRIYRRLGSGPFETLNPRQPSRGNSFEDHRVVNGQTYYYQIRALRKFHDTWLESASSPVVKAVPIDLTPPSAPVNLRGVSTGNGIVLRWHALELADLAGYRVYRREEKEERFRRIGPDLVYDPVFIDRSVKPGHKYYYRVTAVDKSRLANESGWSQEISVTHEP